MTPTEVYDTYWYFAAERQAMYERRLSDPYGPWASDPILKAHRFTTGTVPSLGQVALLSAGAAKRSGELKAML